MERDNKELMYMKRTWKDKLTSRKFWAAVVGFVLSVLVIFGYSEEEQTKTAALITACGTLVAYIVGEGLTDKAAVSTSPLEIALKALQGSSNPSIPNVPIEGDSNDSKREG